MSIRFSSSLRFALYLLPMVVPSSALAATTLDRQTVGEFLASCSRSDSESTTSCLAPLEMLMLSTEYPMTGTAGTAAIACPPSPPQPEVIKPAVVQWLNAHPELGSARSADGIVAAMKALYPCELASNKASHGDFEAAPEVRTYVLAEAIPAGMTNPEEIVAADHGPDVLAGWRIAKDETGKLQHMPDMISVLFNDTGAPLPNFGAHPVVLAAVFPRRVVHDKPPSGTDNRIAETGIPTFFIGSRGRDVWEIGRVHGVISVRMIGDEGIGPWEPFQSDSTKYRYYSQHFLNGRSVSQDFDSKTAALVLAACAGDKAAVAKVVNDGANPNAKGKDGDTPIFWALDCGNLVGLEALLKAGADPNYKLPGRSYTQPPGWGGPGSQTLTTHRYSAMYAAVLTRDLATIKLFTRFGGDPNGYEDDRADNTALWLALRDRDEFQTLFDADKDINFHSDFHASIATQAAIVDRWDVVEAALKRGYSYDLSSLGRDVQNMRLPYGATLSRDEAATRMRIINTLESKGVEFPVALPFEKSTIVMMDEDGSLRVRWGDSHFPSGAIPANRNEHVQTASLQYKELMRKVGKMQPGDTKVLIRRPGQADEEVMP